MAPSAYAETVNLSGTVSDATSLAITNNGPSGSIDLDNVVTDFAIFDVAMTSNDADGWSLTFSSTGAASTLTSGGNNANYTIKANAPTGTLGTGLTVAVNQLSTHAALTSTRTISTTGVATDSTTDYKYGIVLSVANVTGLLPGTYTDDITITAAGL